MAGSSHDSDVKGYFQAKGQSQVCKNYTVYGLVAMMGIGQLRDGDFCSVRHILVYHETLIIPVPFLYVIK